ncbi:MAG: response regulator transcription factor [Eubacterium sp.]|nr:response regulator transcription factor [Eubacterium sp.]
MKLLLIEDEIRMADAIKEIFKQESYNTDVFHDGKSGLTALLTGTYDIAVLDVMLPGLNGFEIVKRAREKNITTPILLLTAKSDLSDKVMGLDLGADDYLTKPFEIDELLARIRVLSRRFVTHSPDKLISFGDLSLNLNTGMISSSVTGNEVRLSEKEFYLLEYLISNSGRIISKEQLATKVWGYDNEAEYNNVEVYISFTRKKLKFIGAKTEIKAVRGLGYELRSGE